MAELTLPQVIDRLRANEARLLALMNGNADNFYTTTTGAKVETVPSVISRLAASIAAASATAATLKAADGAKGVGYGAGTVADALGTQAQGIADNAKAITELDTAKLAKSGGTMTGPLKLAGAPTDPLHAATKGWAEGLLGTYFKPAVGDLLTTVRGAPDATWIPEAANYLQASYPDLFAKVGLLNYEGIGSAFTKTVPFTAGAGLVFGKDGVLMSSDTDPNGTSFYLMRSTDAGVSFASITSPAARINAIATDGAGLWIAGSTVGRVVRSTDNGLTWKVIDTGSGNDILALAQDKKGCWVAATGGAWVMRSTDNGLTWTKITLAANYAMSTIATDGRGTWVGTCGASNTLYSSTDNGLTWSTKTVAYTGTTDPSNWVHVVYGPGVWGLVGWINGGGGWLAPHALSVDGLNWRFGLAQNYSASQMWSFVFGGRDGTFVLCGYTMASVRGTFTLDSKGLPSWGSLTSISVPTYPYGLATDGVGTWVTFSGIDRSCYRVSPAYDVKTLFQAPKGATPPAPFANFIKAK